MLRRTGAAACPRALAIALGAVLLHAPNAAAQLVFQEDFSTGLGSLQASVECAPGQAEPAVWSLATTCSASLTAPSAPHVARFGSVPGCPASYSGGTVVAHLESPEIDIQGCRQLTLVYSYYLTFEEEPTGSGDRARIVLIDADDTETQLAHNGEALVFPTVECMALKSNAFFVEEALVNDPEGDDDLWLENRHDLLDVAASDRTSPIRIRFEAETGDASDNDGQGFLLDDVWVACSREGDQFEINTYTFGSQTEPRIATYGAGEFAVAWRGSLLGPSKPAAQRFASDGSPNGFDLLVSEYNASGTAIASDDSGNLILVWDNNLYIQGRRINSDGSTPAEFQVNDIFALDLGYPDVARQPSGEFLVVWGASAGAGTDTSGLSVQGRRYQSSGVALGGQFQVNTYTSDLQLRPAAEVLADGGFVVAWASGGGVGIRGQRFFSNGALDGPEFEISTYGAGSDDPDIAADSSGGLVAVWDGASPPGGGDPGRSVQMQRFGSNGVPLGVQTQVNSYTSGIQQDPAVAVAENGELLVVWRNSGQGRISAQAFSSNGAPLVGERRIDTFPFGHQPDVDALGPGRFIVTWQSSGSPHLDGSNYSVQGRIVTLPIFADGFESGDTTSWSTTTP